MPHLRFLTGHAPRALALASLIALTGAAHGADEAMWEYAVARGDTLIGITQRLLKPGSDWRALQRVNRVRDPHRLLPGSMLRIPVEMLLEQTQVAEVLHAHGEVSVERAAGAAARPLAGGENLAAGDTVITGAQSSATLRFADGSRVLVRPDSRLRVERTSRLGASSHYHTRLKLDAGSADSQVPRAADGTRRRFELVTPVANLGVRGTEFRTAAEAERARLEVLEGEVGMAAGSARAAVSAGQGTLAQAGGIAPPRPLPPPPALGSVPARVERLPVSIAWQAQSGAARYRAQVFGSDGNLVLDGLFDAPLARWADDLPDGRYELRVRSADAAGLEGRDAAAPFVLKARPEPPLVNEPRARARLGDETVAFAWTRNPAAARYRLQLADSADFAAPLVDRNDFTEPHAALAVPVGRHLWRLASIRADGDMGPWSDVQSFERVALPPPPVAEPPEKSDEGVRLRWATPPEPGLRYRLQVARDVAFTQMVLDQETTDTEWLLRNPEPGVYFVRTRSIQADGFAGPFGAPQQFEVARATPWWPLLLPVLLMLL